MRPKEFSVAGGIQKRLETNIKDRKDRRSSTFDKNRDVSTCDSPVALEHSEAQQKALYRKQQLEKWKEEKDKKKKEAAAKKIKPFVAAKYPNETFGPLPPPPKPVPILSARAARYQARKKTEPQPSSTNNNCFAPSNATFKPSLFLNTPTLADMNKKKVTKPNPNITFEPVLPKKLKEETKRTRTMRARPVANKPVVEKKHPIEKTKAKITQKLQMFHSSSSSSDMDQPSKQISKHGLRKETTKKQEKAVPVVRVTSTSSQDSQDACMSQDTTSMSGEEKEIKNKLDEGLLDEDNSRMESVNHFRRQLNSEIARITARCDTWDQIYAQTALPEPIQELVLAAVGLARLLMSQKLQQFAGLVEQCARLTPGEAIVTPTDLHGFWDMVVMQVEDVDSRFKTLEELRLRHWIEEQQPVHKKVAKPSAAAKKAAAKPTGGPSRLKQMIAAVRRAKKESQSENSGSEKSEATQSSETKTFEAGFFQISTPLKTVSATTARPSNKSSLLSVSKQTPTIAPVNVHASPGRSIAEQKNPVSANKRDQLKTVLFHKDEEPSSPTSSSTSKPASSRRSRLCRQHAEDPSSSVSVDSDNVQKKRNTRKRAQKGVEADEKGQKTRAETKRNTSSNRVLQKLEAPKRSRRTRSPAAV